ncbi:MAG: hypothetical protein O3B09_02935, partial [Proteobacteria bacterium]|nr:hypothetical protein [Pseudomonadota bacterium]
MLQQSQIKKNRLLFVYFCIIAAFLIITLRLIFVSIAGDPVTINSLYSSSQISKRANIVDRNNIIVAADIETKSLYIDSILIKDPQLTAKALSDLFPDLDYKDLLQKISNRKSYGWLLAKRNITPKQQKEIQDLQMAGLLFENDLTRIYPQKSILSHIIGYVDLDR